ncbi:MAG TPA: hypothetical protein DCP08_01380 [Chloroflexi bacterium]|nr:hypothetical protein [Chloroflexota bacterium]
MPGRVMLKQDPRSRGLETGKDLTSLLWIPLVIAVADGPATEAVARERTVEPLLGPLGKVGKVEAIAEAMARLIPDKGQLLVKPVLRLRMEPGAWPTAMLG